jgi:hypothetical protein
MNSYIRTFPTRNLSRREGGHAQGDSSEGLPKAPAKYATTYGNVPRQTVSDDRSINMPGDTTAAIVNTHFKMADGIQPNKRGTAADIGNPEEWPPYHTFTERKRSLLVVLVGAAALIPQLTAGMYLPATHSIGSVGFH